MSVDPKCDSSINLQDDGKYRLRSSKIPKPRNGAGKSADEKAIACLEEKNNNSFLQLYITKVYFLQDKLKNKDLDADLNLDEDVTELANKISALCHKIKDVESCMFIGKQNVNPQIEFGPAGDVDLITNEHIIKNINRFNSEFTNNEGESDDLFYFHKLDSKCEKENANKSLNAKSSQLFCPMDFTFENMFHHSENNTQDTPKPYKTTVHKLPKIIPLDSKDKGSISRVLEMLSYRTEEIMKRISVMDVNIKQLRIFKEAAQTSEICQYCKLFFDELTRQKQEITEIVNTLKGCVNNVPFSYNNFQEQIETLTKGVNTMLDAKKTPVILQNSGTSPKVSNQLLKATCPSLDISNKTAESCSSDFRRPINIINEIHFQNESGLCNATELVNIEEVTVGCDQIPNSEKKVSENSKPIQGMKTCFLKSDEKPNDKKLNKIDNKEELSSEILNSDEKVVNEIFTGTLKTKIMQGEVVNSECRCNCCESLMFSNNCTCKEAKESSSKYSFTFDEKEKYIPSFYSMRNPQNMPKISYENKFSDAPRSADSISAKKSKNKSSKIKSSDESFIMVHPEGVKENLDQVSEKTSQNGVIWRKIIDDHSVNSKWRNQNVKKTGEIQESWHEVGVIHELQQKFKDISKDNIVEKSINKNKPILPTDVYISDKTSCKNEQTTKIDSSQDFIKQSSKKIPVSREQTKNQSEKDNFNDISLSKSYKLNIKEKWSYDEISFKDMCNQTSDTVKLVTRSDTNTKLDDHKIDKLRSILRMNAQNPLKDLNGTTGTSKELNNDVTTNSKKVFDNPDVFVLRMNANSPLEDGNGTKETSKELNNDVSTNNMGQSDEKYLNPNGSLLKNANSPLLSKNSTKATSKGLNKELINNSNKNFDKTSENIVSNSIQVGDEDYNRNESPFYPKIFSEKSCLCNFCNNKSTSMSNGLLNNNKQSNELDLTAKQKCPDDIFEDNLIDKFCSCSDVTSTLSDNTLNESYTKEQINERNKKILAVEIPKIISEKNVKHLSRRLIKSDGVIYLPKIVPVNIRKIFTNKKATNDVRECKKYYKTGQEKTYKQIEAKHDDSLTDDTDYYLPRNKSKLGFLVPKVFVKKPDTPPKNIAQKIFVTINTEQKFDKVPFALPEVKNKQACFISHQQIVETAQNVSSKFRNWGEEFNSGSEVYSQCSSDKNSSEVLNNGYENRMSKNLDVLYNLDTEPCKLKSFNYDSVSLFKQPVSEPELFKDSVENYKNRKDVIRTFEKPNIKLLPMNSSCTSCDSEQKELNIEQELGNLAVSVKACSEKEKYVLCLAKDSHDMRRLERLGLRPVDVTRKMVKANKKQTLRVDKEEILQELKESILRSLKTAKEFNDRLGEKESKDFFDTERTFSSKNVAEDLDDMMKYFGSHRIKSFDNVPRTFSNNPDAFSTRSDPANFKKKPSLFKKMFRRHKLSC